MGKDLTMKDVPPQGKCSSRRGWKTAEKCRSSSGRPRSLSKSFSRKQEIERETRELRSMIKEIKEAKEQEESIRKERVRRSIELKLEKQKRAEVIQKVSPSKVKRMTRKKLRGIRKSNNSSLLISKE